MLNKIVVKLGTAALTSSYVDAAVAATTTLTSDTTVPADGDTVTLGATAYRFKTTPSQAYDVARSATAAQALLNLKQAIAGLADGVNVYNGTLANPSVTAGTATATTLPITAIVPGSAGNSIASTETSAHLSFTGATLAGGGDSQTFATNGVLEGFNTPDNGEKKVGSLAAEGINQVVFIVVVDTTGRADTYQPQELFGYDGNSDGIDDIGWSPVYELGTSPAMVAVERTITGQLVYTYAFKTIADAARLRLKGAGTATVYAALSQNQG